jgi:ring-1,2-phenylacetyl-CoA epoxidase subunit PaaB
MSDEAREPSSTAGGDAGAANVGEEPDRSRRLAWPLWEVFVRPRRGLAHAHVGSLHAADAEMALRMARDLYTRRGEGVSIWVVPTAEVVASSPGEADPFFAPALDKAYRHPSFYDLPAEARL